MCCFVLTGDGGLPVNHQHSHSDVCDNSQTQWVHLSHTKKSFKRGDFFKSIWGFFQGKKRGTSEAGDIFTVIKIWKSNPKVASVETYMCYIHWLTQDFILLTVWLSCFAATLNQRRVSDLHQSYIPFMHHGMPLIIFYLILNIMLE